MMDSEVRCFISGKLPHRASNLSHDLPHRTTYNLKSSEVGWIRKACKGEDTRDEDINWKIR